MQYLELKLWKCRNDSAEKPKGVVCKDKNAIDNYFKDETFNFAFVNSMFQQDNFTDPISYFIDDQVFFEIDPSTSKKANFYVQEQTAQLEDDIIQLGQSKQLTFYQVLNVKSYDDNYSDAPGENYMVAIYMRSDKMYDSYERKVNDLLTFMGDIGGLSEALIGIGAIIVGFITQKMFMSKIVRKIYHIRKYENIEHEAQERQTRKVKVDGNEADFERDISTQRERINGSQISVNQQELDLVKSKEQVLSYDFKDKKQIKNDDIQSIFFAFLNRARFKYTINNIIEYIMRCLCIRDLGDNRRDKKYKRHFLFEKAEEKFMQELDVVRIVKTLRKFKMFAQAMLAQRHRLILRFQRQNLVETSSSSSDSDDNNYDPVRLMENKNPMVRLITYGKVKKMMMQFQNTNIDYLEKNMMRGMFRRKLKDFAELQKENQEYVSLLDRFKQGAGEETPSRQKRYLSDLDNPVLVDI